MLKKYALSIAVVFTLLLTIASFVKFNNIPKIGLSIEDKLFHFAAYAVLTFVWYNVLIKSVYKEFQNKSIVTAFLFAIIYGIIIEVLQGQLTMSRVTEFNDAVANSLGAIFMALLIKLNALRVKKY